MKKKSPPKDRIWVKRTLEVLLPCDGVGNYQDIFAYLAKVVDSLDPKYKYIIGLLNTCYARCGSITTNQKKMADDIISYFKDRGYFEEGGDE